MRSSTILSISAFFALSSAVPTPAIEARGCITGQNGCNTAELTFIAAGGKGLNVTVTLGHYLDIFTAPGKSSCLSSGFADLWFRVIGGDLSWSQIKLNEPLRNFDLLSKCKITANEKGVKNPVLAGPVGFTNCEACNPLYDIGPPMTIASIVCGTAN